MNRLQEWIRIGVLVLVTFCATEWVHYRLGASPLLQRMLGSAWPFDNELSRAAHGGPESVTENQFQAYVRILEAMQADRSLSIETAVASEHISLGDFRDLEQRIQRNEVLIDRTRHLLREKAESLWNARGAPLEHG